MLERYGALGVLFESDPTPFSNTRSNGFAADTYRDRDTAAGIHPTSGTEQAFRTTGLSRPGSRPDHVTARSAPHPPAPPSPSDRRPPRGTCRGRASPLPPPTLATPRNYLPPLPPLPAPAAVQLMDPAPGCRAQRPHPGHPVPHPGLQPRISPHIATGLRDLDTHGHGADRRAPRSNVRSRRGTASNPSPHPTNHILQTLMHPGAEQTAAH